MRIGIVGKKDGVFVGIIDIPFLGKLQVALEKVESQKDQAPAYRIHWDHATGESIGALWKRTPSGGGDAFLSGHLESPVFPGGKCEIAMFAAKEPERRGQLDVTWRPRPERSADRPQARQSWDDTSPGAQGPDSVDDISF